MSRCGPSCGECVIMVTGTTGQVGRELLRSLAGLGRIVGVDRAALDLEDPARIREAVRALRPSLIVNPAAYTLVDQAENDVARAFQVNACAPGILAEEAARLGVPLIHYSTDYVYDGAKGSDYDETDPTNPRNVYGRSKLSGEDAIRASHCRHLIFRTGWIYGGAGRNFVDTMLRLGATRDVVRVVDDQFGAPTWARVLADISANVIARSLAASGTQHGGRPLPHALDAGDEVWWRDMGGTYHVSAGGETSWAECARAIFAYAGVACRVEPIPTSAYPTPARRPARSCLSNDKLTRTFGLAAPDWRTSLRNFLDDRQRRLTSADAPPATWAP